MDKRIDTAVPVSDKIRQHVLRHLEELRNGQSLEPLKQLFWTVLNYERENTPLFIPQWTNDKDIVGNPILFATGADGAFKVIYIHLVSEHLSRSLERSIVSKLLQKHLYTLFIFSNYSQNRWHFLNVKYDQDNTKRRLFRRISVGPEERLRTATDRLSMLDLASIDPTLFGIQALDIQAYHDEAFDVEAVTKQFFEEYKMLFKIIQDDLHKQVGDHPWAHDYALQFLNRCMFLYFIQRKRWLGEQTEFLRAFWDSYNSSEHEKDTFFEQWLKVLFFEAFNRRFNAGHRHFPTDIHRILALAPFLNGGLFAENELDRRGDFTITDSRFAQVLTFLERYNFTITEDSPLDQEVAVDPEMIGKVYESLVNVAGEADERGDAGIFYTPRTEIDLMCRLTLVDYLANHLGQQYKNLLYRAIFALEPEDKIDSDIAIDAQIWQALDDLLREVRVIDPACGSGSFLVGMLYVLDDLQVRAHAALQKERVPEDRVSRGQESYERKKRIIGQNLYGVDVMDWAVHVAELRLWLALIVDATFTSEELHLRNEPLLPYFTFKIRCGDSLVQEVGGINLGHNREIHAIPQSLKSRVEWLKTQKLLFYNNVGARELRSKDDVLREERRLFKDILNARLHEVKEEIKSLNRKIEGPPEQQLSFDDQEVKLSSHKQAQIVEWQRQKEQYEHEQEQLERARVALEKTREIPFVWDIAFVEIFADNERFDIVIGNPPYVRQEQIADPRLPPQERTTENKKAYKTKLARSVYEAFPRFFGYNSAKDTAIHQLNRQSDLYIYFYLHGLSLLNDKGSFCFITSNSWLDVGYGADLQEFLLKHCHIKLILDNETWRSFASAGVNTVIVLLSSPDERSAWGLTYTARFVMSRVGFEQLLSPIIFEGIEAVQERTSTLEYRVYPIAQKKLLEDGLVLPEEGEGESGGQYGTRIGKRGTLLREAHAHYTGNKWGGKYLRASDIYWTILEKGKGQLVRLGDVAEVRFGIKTGANEFFYLDDQKIKQWGIEEEFLKPVIKSPRECKTILIKSETLKFKMFLCHRSKEELRGTAALKYIEWGELQNFHKRPSCAGRPRWWSLSLDAASSIFVKEANDTSAVFYNPNNYPADCRLYYADLSTMTIIYLNSAIGAMLFEIYNRAGLGEGARSMMVSDYAQVPVLTHNGNVDDILQSVYILPPRKLTAVPTIEWLNIDSIIFDIFGLTQGERDAVYEAVIKLVEARLEKASSLESKESAESKERRKRVEAAEKLRGIWVGLPQEEGEEELESRYA